jgi:hypothetical protein
VGASSSRPVSSPAAAAASSLPLAGPPSLLRGAAGNDGSRYLITGPWRISADPPRPAPPTPERLDGRRLRDLDPPAAAPSVVTAGTASPSAASRGPA